MRFVAKILLHCLCKIVTCFSMRDVLLLRTPFDNLFLRLDPFWEMAWCVVVNQLVTVCIQLKVTDLRPDRPTPLAKKRHFVKNKSFE